MTLPQTARTAASTLSLVIWQPTRGLFLTTIAGEVRLARAFAIVVDGGAVDQCAELRVVVPTLAAISTT